MKHNGGRLESTIRGCLASVDFPVDISILRIDTEHGPSVLIIHKAVTSRQGIKLEVVGRFFSLPENLAGAGMNRHHRLL